MNSPRVSIITPAFNAAETIGDTIDSVRSQVESDWEYLIVDDGSRDKTAQIVEESLGDPRIRLIKQENRGAANARNRGLEQSRGRYLAFLDADDTWRPRFLSQLIAALEADPEAGQAWCDMQIIGSGQLYRGERSPIEGRGPDTLRAIYRSVTYLPSCCLFRRDPFERGLRWDQSFAPMEDMPIFCAVASQSKVVYVGETLADYRVHAGSQTTSAGAHRKHYPAMVKTFRQLYRDYSGAITPSEYRTRLATIYQQAADDSLQAGQSGLGLCLQALRYQPSRTVIWKLLILGLLHRFPRSRSRLARESLSG